MPLQATSGAASYDAFGGGVPVAANYIEDVFSTWLYTGNGSTQTINNGIDLAGKGGLVWVKSRSNSSANSWFDTARGANKAIWSESTSAQYTYTDALTSFNSNGFTLGPNWDQNLSGATWASWTFRKQPKFFDVVTWVGNGTNQTVNHSLGSLPGCIIYKRTDSTSDWFVSTRNSAGNYEFLKLNTTAASVAAVNPASLDVTATSFDPLRLWGNVNGASYVAYLFAHNAGGFGLTGTDNVISCGSYVGNGSTQDINLGYEAQWVLVKNATTAGWDWYTVDNMRGFVVTPASPNFTKSLSPNTSGAESDQTAISPSSTGFRLNSGAGAFNQSGQTYIYIAIRRGPMKTPTTGTSVFAPALRTGTGATGSSTSLGNVTDLTMIKWRDGAAAGAWAFTDRLRGATLELIPSSTGAEFAAANDVTGFDSMTGFRFGTGVDGRVNTSPNVYIDYLFRRAPGFFDEVCYTGTGGSLTVNHNLGVAPELIITKSRSASQAWTVQKGGDVYYGVLNTTFAFDYAGDLFTPTATQLSIAATGLVNTSGTTYVAYLFASCLGVSKVGTYTGTGTTQVINCGFTAGSRFVLIKRTDSSGDWYVWDSARGIVAGNDPYLLFNSTAAQVTNTDFIDTAATGFEISSTAPAAINASGGTFIFLAIA